MSMVKRSRPAGVLLDQVGALWRPPPGENDTHRQLAHPMVDVGLPVFVRAREAVQNRALDVDRFLVAFVFGLAQ